jgi:DNA invertase Pin-like site-specific DNA recombinase
MAKMESDLRLERTKPGMARRKAAGLPIGRLPGSKDKTKRKRSSYVPLLGAAG